MLRWPGILLLALLSSGLMVSHAAVPRPALAVDNGAGQVPDLKQTLNYGLKARLPSEFAFIRHVNQLVEEKRLSRAVVLRTFTWARGQSDKMPFPYFQFALRAQAKKFGVQL
ncbi:MAG: hypothetical protein K8T91_00195 [Planctomycetes bacterium]|nr:hypothetical protein [Planctomycetota bacterium]